LVEDCQRMHWRWVTSAVAETKGKKVGAVFS
jgi:hypothetical protein